MQDGKLSRLMKASIGPTTEICGNPGLPFTMVPCLHQCNVYIKRKLQVWRVQNAGSTFRHGSMFASKQCLYQKEVTGIESLKMHSSSRWNNRTYLCGTANYPVSCNYWDENGNLKKSRCTFPHGTMFAPKQCLYQKEATGMESP